MMASEEIYFRRADLFIDKGEGLPPEDYALRVLGFDPFNIDHLRQLNNHLGSLAQRRESYYVSCWYLYAQGLETLDMWELYGHDGVAVVTRYDLLYDALDRLLDEAHLGQIQYGTDHLTDRFNALEFLTTKQKKYALDCEVRAFITAYDPLTSRNRHVDPDNNLHPHPLSVNPRNSWIPDCKRRRVDLQKLVTDVVISPWAEPEAVEEINLWVKHKGFPAATQKSELTATSTPTLAKFRQHRHLFSKRPEEVGVAQESEATEREVQQFAEAISALPDERVRWLYKKRWDVMRLNPGEIPLLSDAQYLETTLRILDARKKRKTTGELQIGRQPD
ncbi:MAG: hypothetical protein ACRD3F_17130 [Acidobacteriaceae bacterium]